MDLIGGYLLVMLLLFAGNNALLLGNFSFDNAKLIFISFAFAAVTFILLNASSYLNINIIDYFTFIFFVMAILIFMIMFFFVRNNKFELSLYSMFMLDLVAVILFASQTDLEFFEMILYSLFVFIILFVAYQLSKLLHHAKRQYSVIIGEYMCLASVLMFIFAFTFNSTVNLDYSKYSAYLILTPTYQLIYVVIAVIVILIIGVLINDSNGGNS